MEAPESKRRLSSSGEDARREFITKRLKSVDELSSSWRYMDSIESVSRSTSVDMQSFSRSTSLDLQSFSRSASIESSKSDALVLDMVAETQTSVEPVENDNNETSGYYNFPETVEMASQPTDPDMFDESLCYLEENEDQNSSRCKLLKQISSTILSVDEEPPGEFRQETNVCDVLAYVQSVSPDDKTGIAEYLSSGSLAHAQLTMGNIHHFYHVASLLHLKQLREHCIKYCRLGNQTDIIACFEGCECQNEIKSESATGYKRSQSVVSNPDDSDPPQYYIVFTDTVVSGNKDKRKVKVMVIDTSQKRNVYYHEVDKLRNFGEGFACCSFEIKGTPFIMVSGGEGKNAHLVMKYDIILGRWDKCAKLLHGRSHHMMVTAGPNSIYALGGSELSCIEEYCLKTNKWTERASLVSQVTSAVCKVYQNKIYIFGGRTPAGPIATTQCYDIDSHVIERLADLPVAFDGGQAVILNDRIYIATDQGHMIRFNPNTGYSRLCTQQPIHRKQFGMFVKQDRIYVVGGVLCADSKTARIPQYRYNAEKDVWLEKNKLCYSFSVLASCIINFEKKCCVIPFNEKF
ncbi:kelch-like protein 10 [Mercenaria mercenaria]|uniref:kelch-like protein 10 n=1 Tax=Mercenaria mercenaria TaxID=6596 RepID=UPI00234E5D25|nr:kelch-like protein 10 [Mercenaria mercenaria]XP_053396290.1 kelch-like protein 10 [Mercenaria mercenaria]XP_053396291.1 kelch-like protein 10 [Mercenaria mercenaria]